jgi:hypothetical protein
LIPVLEPPSFLLGQKNNNATLVDSSRTIASSQSTTTIAVTATESYSSSSSSLLPSSLDSLSIPHIVLVVPETSLYRRLCVVHTLPNDHFVEIGCDSGTTVDRVYQTGGSMVGKSCTWNVPIIISNSAAATTTTTAAATTTTSTATATATISNADTTAANTPATMPIAVPSSVDTMITSLASKSSVARVTGYDKSVHSIRQACERFPYLAERFHVWDILNNDFPCSTSTISSPTSSTSTTAPFNDAHQHEKPPPPQQQKQQQQTPPSPDVLAIDINGNRPLPHVLQCIQRVFDIGWTPRLIVVKSRTLLDCLLNGHKTDDQCTVLPNVSIE